MTESRIAFLATLPMLIGAVLVLALRKPPAMDGQDATRRDASAAVDEARAPEQAAYPGVVVSGYTADVGAEIGGSVIEVAATTGQRLSAGALLLRVDPKTAGDDMRVAAARLEQQRSAIARAEAELSEASDLVERLQSITDGVPERSIVAARAREQQARAAVAEARAGLIMLQAELGRQRTRSDKHIIRAPFEGVVVALYVDPGDVVVPGQIVARVITEDFYVRFAVPPQDVGACKTGRLAEVRLGKGPPLPAEITDVQPEVDAAAQLVFARARIDKAAAQRVQLIPGARVEVHLPAAGDAELPKEPE